MSSDPEDLTAHLTLLRLRNLSPRTIDQRRYALLRLAALIPCEPDELLALTSADLDQWQRDIAHLSPRYRSVWATHVRQFYRWAQGQGLVRDDPSTVLVTVHVPRCLPHPIGESDLELAIATAPHRVRCWLVLAAYAGLRAGEIATLHRDQVCDVAVPPVLFLTGKGGRQRVVPMSDRVLMELRVSGLPSRGFVFARQDGKLGANAPHTVSQLANRHLHGLGITETLHSLRHRFGSQVYAVSQDLRMTQEVMGHQSPATTAGYVAWSSAAAVEAIRRIAHEPNEALTA